MKPMTKRIASALLAVALTGLTACSKTPTTSTGGEASQPVAQSTPPSASAPQVQEPSPVLPTDDEVRAMWVAYPDLELVDFATEDLFRGWAQEMVAECTAMGLNTVIFIVRPFSDAVYPSVVFPWSYLVNGIQGVDPGYDPLAIAIQESHAAGLRFEAYINPYRIRLNSVKPGQLSADNPAIQNPDLAGGVGESMWYNPGLPEVRSLVVEGVREIVENYDVDGIHFDDYFYPAFDDAGQDAAFDEESYALYGNGMDKAAWRRENVNILVQEVYQTIKEINPDVVFGISPQGNNDNNYNQQYSDVKLWMATPGYVDYVMPQIYWGFGWRSSSGANTAAFDVKCAEWAGYPRDASVALYIGLGAYRIGAGDGSVGEQDEWYSGHALAEQIRYLRTEPGIGGYALFRYEHVTSGANPLYREEAAAIAAVNAEG